MLTFKALGWLLTYPESTLVAALPEVIGAIEDEELLSARHLSDLRRLSGDIGAEDLIETQERYVALFDRARSVSLHLFEHIHGESRERGAAMVALRELYAKAGLEAEANELPDFLPMYLEYLSLLPEAEARHCLADAGTVLMQIHARLARRESRYAVVFAALLELAGLKPEVENTGPDASADETSNDAIDRAWAEAPVTFGPDAAPDQGCAQADSILERMRAFDRKSETPTASRPSLSGN
jgi:nitrate reductase molybdenum cofactor assembly chaperone NarJ/NarW